jgi:pilus assembly protein Flp/PilA
MHGKLLRLYLTLLNLVNQEDGQDLIEYALISALIAVTAISGMKHIASAVLTVFSNVSSLLG